jgi:formamidopyrimidine-DNA glycosylase
MGYICYSSLLQIVPELPEVETICRGLGKAIVGRRISTIEVLRERNALWLSSELLADDEFREVSRRGKFIFMELASRRVLLAHLRMTGSFAWVASSQQVHKHTRLIIRCQGEMDLRYRDLRALGWVQLCRDIADARAKLPKMGPEPLSEEFRPREFWQSLKNYRSPIKAVLLDQAKAVAGVGNIYADEALFLAGIHPERPSRRIHLREATNLHAGIIEVLTASIGAGGTTLRNHEALNGDSGLYSLQLKVHGRQGKPCPSCGVAIERIRVIGRSSYYCPSCQKR